MFRLNPAPFDGHNIIEGVRPAWSAPQIPPGGSLLLLPASWRQGRRIQPLSCPCLGEAAAGSSVRMPKGIHSFRRHAPTLVVANDSDVQLRASGASQKRNKLCFSLIAKELLEHFLPALLSLTPGPRSRRRRRRRFERSSRSPHTIKQSLTKHRLANHKFAIPLRPRRII